MFDGFFSQTIEDEEATLAWERFTATLERYEVYSIRTLLAVVLIWLVRKNVFLYVWRKWLHRIAITLWQWVFPRARNIAKTATEWGKMKLRQCSLLFRRSHSNSDQSGEFITLSILVAQEPPSESPASEATNMETVDLTVQPNEIVSDRLVRMNIWAFWNRIQPYVDHMAAFASAALFVVFVVFGCLALLQLPIYDVISYWTSTTVMWGFLCICWFVLVPQEDGDHQEKSNDTNRPQQCCTDCRGFLKYMRHTLWLFVFPRVTPIALSDAWEHPLFAQLSIRQKLALFAIELAKDIFKAVVYPPILWFKAGVGKLVQSPVLVLTGCVLFLLVSLGVSYLYAGNCTMYYPSAHFSTRFTRSFLPSYCEDNGRGGPPCHVYITWPEDPTTSVIVNFHTARAGRPFVLFGTTSHTNTTDYFSVYDRFATGDTYLKQNEEMKRFVHRVLLTELVPNTIYYFRAGWHELGTTRGGFSDEKIFRTLPADDRTPYSFVAGGDIGLSSTAYKMAKLAASFGPWFALLGGDLAYANSMETCWRRWDDFLWFWEDNMVTPEGLMIPMVAAPGNHETAKFDLAGETQSSVGFYLPYLSQSSADDQKHIWRRKSYHYHLIGNSSLVLALDSSSIVSAGDPEQMAFLQTTLAHFGTSVENRFAFYHRALYPSTAPVWEFGDENYYMPWWWEPLFDAYHLTAAFENHVHAFKRTTPVNDFSAAQQGTLYFGDGAWGVPTLKQDIMDYRYGEPYDQDFRTWIETLERYLSANNVWRVDVRYKETEYTAYGPDGQVLDNVLLCSGVLCTPPPVKLQPRLWSVQDAKVEFVGPTLT